ncbi:MAG: hypothetical protein LQ337_004417 [Flavoplaca oasis]|nr:MAG: hypothetical protein LQ337_004417 [Flavoplaca oasis]
MCNATFSSTARLALHDSKHHADKLSTTFVFFNPGSKQRRSVHTTTGKRFIPTSVPSYVPMQQPAARFPRSTGPQHMELSTPLSFRHDENFTDSSDSSASPASTDDEDCWSYEPDMPTYGQYQNRYDGQTYRSSPAQVTSIPREPPQTAILRAPPQYECRTSRKNPGEPKAWSWLTREARDHFHRYFKTLMGSWGVASDHTATCVLVSEDWRPAVPLDLMALFSVDNVPTAGSPRAWYSYQGFGTSLARAKVWFSKPRRAIDLDQLLECEGYPPMDASHLCHHEFCVVHLVYEPADVNQERNECQRRARFLRGEKRQVLVLPYRLRSCHTDIDQRAAVTALEACYHQFAVLSKAYGFPPLPYINRPRRYPFPTIEAHLPNQFSSISLDEARLVSKTLLEESAAGGKQYRPDLTCNFCVATNLKTYATIVGLWAHIINVHQDVDNSDRFEEIRRCAGLWYNYWQLHSKGGKRTNPTLVKLKEAQAEDFSWSDVLNWHLRWG